MHIVFYCNILENTIEFEDSFFTDYIELKKTGLQVREFLIGLVDREILYFGYIMPAITKLAKLLQVARNTVIKAFRGMVAAGYLSTHNGTRAVIRHPAYSQNIELRKGYDATYLDSTCMRPCYLTNDLIACFQGEKKRSYEKVPPSQQNQVYTPLLLTLCEQLNQFQRTNYFPANIYYMHDYQSLIRCVGSALYEKGGSVIIPRQVSNLVRRGLESAGVKLVEVDTDGYGFSINGLVRAFAENKIIAIYMTPCINYADSADTPIERMEEIFKFFKTYQFKLIIDDWYRPWLGNQKNYVLDMAKGNLDSIIYLKPLTYLYEEMSRLYMVAAHQKLILKMRDAAKKYGKQAYYSVAVAANYVLNDSIFTKTIQQVQVVMEDLKRFVNEVFTSTGFWKEYGLRLGSGPMLYVVPKAGRFSPDAYNRARDAGVLILSPANYTITEMIFRGIRADLGGQIGSKHINSDIRKIEKLFRDLCK